MSDIERLTSIFGFDDLVLPNGEPNLNIWKEPDLEQVRL